MKRIVAIVLAVVLFTGVYATTNNAGKNDLKQTTNKYLVELLDVSPEFKKGENEELGMSSAFMVKQNDSANELFGAFWAEFGLEAVSESSSYKTNNWTISDIRLGENLSAEELKQVEDLLYKELKSEFENIDKGSVDAALHGSRDYDSDVFNTAAPLIIYSNYPSALVVIDGNPYYENLDERYSRISNAGTFIVKDGKRETYYLYGGGLWFSSQNALSGWAYLEKVPNRITKVMRKYASDLYESMNKQQEQSQIVPEIIVTTEPSELISTNGSPEYVVIPEANLIYAKNTDAELFRDITTNKFYSLFSGRWFVSDRLEGNWKFLAAGELPDGFAKIPEDHDKSAVLASVPGTKAAENAVKDALVPFVTKNDISTLLNTEVNYDGEPEFAAIKGTDLLYAVNTPHQVLMWNKRYYLVEEAVWYNSSSAGGPWRIATQRPVGVENIPADNPLFNLKYVYVYKQTDNEVYTGYTSGYTGSYTNGTTVVYGTGYHYSGWHGHHYYHHPMTYGFGFYYDPFYGWGPVYSPWYGSSFYWHWHWRPWYGHRPPYYRPPGHRPPHHRPPHHRPPSGGRPEQPIARPDRPSTLPAQPSTRPSQPNVRPSQPSTRPSQPSVRPSQPSFRPSQPAMRPSGPAARPSPGLSRMR